MDKRKHIPEDDTLERALEALRKLGLKAERRAIEYTPANGKRADTCVRLTYGGHVVNFNAEVKHHLRPATLGAVLHQLGQLDPPALLIADHVTPGIAEILRERGVEFVDAVGNVFIDRPPLLIQVRGERREPGIRRPEAGRAFTATGLQVVFALLCLPGLVDRPYREIAQLAGVAHGTVGWVMAELPALGFMARVGRRRRLLNPQRLLQQWAMGYARTLRPRLVLGRYHATDQAMWGKLDPAKYDYVLGGEAGEARYTGYLRPQTLTLFGERIEKRFLTDNRLYPDPDGEVEVLKRFWNFTGVDEPLAPVPLIYADLLWLGDTRCLEAAEVVYRKLKDGFETQG